MKERSHISPIIKRRRGFTIFEVLISTLITFFIVLGIWGVYEMVSIWWYETSPTVQAQQIARIALSCVIDGRIDATAGYDVMTSGERYNRRNGIAWAKSYVIPASGRINFTLESDADDSNARAFLLGTDAATGLNVVQYINNSGSTSNVAGTSGVDDLQFTQISANVIKVSVSATSAQPQGRPAVTVDYDEFVCLKNCSI